LISISKSYIFQNYIEDYEITEGNMKRIKNNKELTTYLQPVLRKPGIEADLGIIALRIKQGDFFIIEDKASFLKPMLTTPEIRKLTMALCGFFTHPTQFKTPLPKNPHKFTKSLSFEGAIEIFAENFGINPIIPRIVNLDSAFYKQLKPEQHLVR
jgi:hypothetical protein